MTRQWQHVSAAGPVTVSSGASTTHLRLTFTGTEGDTWLVFMNCSVLGAANSQVRVFNNYYEQAFSPVNAADYQSCPMFYWVTLGAGANNFSEAIACEDALGNSYTIRDMDIFALKLDPLDAIPANFDGADISSASYVDVNSVTVPATGDYLILCCTADNYNGTTTADNDIQVVIDDEEFTDWYNMDYRTNNATYPYGFPWAAVKASSLNSGSAVTIQAKRSAGTLQISYATIILLRLSTFSSTTSTSSRDGGTDATTADADPFGSANSAEIDYLSLTPATSNSHVLFGTCMATRATAANRVNQRTRLDSTSTLRASINAAKVANSESSHTTLAVLSAASHTVVMQWARYSAASNAIIGHGAMCALELPTPPIIYLRSGTFRGGTYR